MKPAKVSPSVQRTSPATSGSKPEVAAFIAAVLRQSDHAADLVIAFFRAAGMAGAKGQLDGAYLQLREWHDAGVIQWTHPEGLALDDMIATAIEQLRHGPEASANSQHGTDAMTTMIRTWHETCSPVAREHLDCDVAIEWDCGHSLDEVVEMLAEFVWIHRNQVQIQEVA